MKKQNIIKSVVFLNLSLLAGCAEVSLDSLKEKPAQGSPYSQALAEQYQGFADRECYTFNDPFSTSLYSKKGLKAASGNGEAVAPEKPEEWLITGALLSEMQADRARLLKVQQAGGFERAPVETAAAQRYYDEWIEQSAEGWQPNDIAHAHQMFLENLQLAETRTFQKTIAVKAIPQPDHTGSVYFKLNSSKLGPTAIQTLDGLKKFITPDAYVTVKGFTDKCGKAYHNKILSEKRAKTVNQYLLGHQNVAKDLVEGEGVAPDSPYIEPRNRRVDIKIYTPEKGLKITNR